MLQNKPKLIIPNWPAPSVVCSAISTREGGISQVPFDGFNLANHVGDASQAVSANREYLHDELGLQHIQWLNQVHGTAVIDAQKGATAVEADAVYTDQVGIGCAVLTADCLPVLFCSMKGDEVACAHAGWRGLASGILENTVGRFNAGPDQLLAYLGPAIGQQAFEVGEEVRDAFLQWENSASDQIADCFVSCDVPGKYLADLYGLARWQLNGLGVHVVFGGDYCTYSEQQRFYSYRRDGVTGRMASVVFIKS